MKSKLRFELDDFGKIGITLEEFDTLYDMDRFMQQFKDSNAVKEAYLDEINKFLNSDAAKSFLKLINGRENNGYLRGYTEYNNRFVHMPLIYESILIPERERFRGLKIALNNKSVLCDLYYRKPYLLPSSPTLYLRNELCRVVVKNHSCKDFIRNYAWYIEDLDDDERFFIYRSLADKCHLLNKDKLKSENVFKIRKYDERYELVKTKHYSFGDYSDEEIHKMIPDDDKFELRDGANSSFTMKDMVRLLEEYDLDEIDRNTDYFDNKGKTR